MHLDDYALGEGDRQTGKQGPLGTERHIQTTVQWTDRNESYISLGGDQLSVERAADAAIQLAEAVERVRAKHQALTMKRWRVAFNELTGEPY